MSNKNIKTGIQNAFIDSKLTDNVDKLIASCLMYDFISKIIEKDSSVQNDIRVLAQNYVDLFTRKLYEAKNNFISYDLMRSEVISFNKNNFIAFTNSEIRRIDEIYLDKTMLKKFSVFYFSQYAYKLLNLSEYHYKRLSENHFKVMVPLVSFYMDSLKISDSDVEIFSSLGYRENPGKEVIFKIKNVEPAKIISDIRSFKIPIKESDSKLPNDFFKIDISGDYLKIIFN
jgi:hypothetical protein